MSSEPGGPALEEAHTDPFLPRITDDLLPPLEHARVPVLDDDSLAELIADLDEPGTLGSPAAVPAQRDGTGSRRVPPWPGGARVVAPRQGDAPVAPQSSTRRSPSVPPDDDPVALRIEQEAQRQFDAELGLIPDLPARTDALRPSWPPSAPEPDPAAPPSAARLAAVAPGAAAPDEEDEPRTFGPDDDPSVLRESADGPVLRCRHGDFRPPVQVGRRSRVAPRDDWYLPDAPSLTGLGLTRRSWSRRGSRLFHWTFAAIFALIALQLVVGLLTAAAGS